MYDGRYSRNAPYRAPLSASTIEEISRAPKAVLGVIVLSAQQSNLYSINMRGIYEQQPLPLMSYSTI